LIITLKPRKSSYPNPICFIGIDGSGKSTLARYLFGQLKKSNIQCSRVHIRYPNTFSFLFLGFCRIAGFTKIRKDGNQIIHEHNFTSKPLKITWCFFRIFDLCLHLALRVHLRILLGRVVVCDRFIHDVLVDMMIEMRDYALSDSLTGRIMLALVPSRAAIFFVELDAHDALQRAIQRSIGWKHPDMPSLEGLISRSRLYEQVSKNCLKLDGRSSLKSLQDKVMRFLSVNENDSTMESIRMTRMTL